MRPGPVDLTALDEPAGEVVLPDTRRVVPVRGLTGAALYLRQRISDLAEGKLEPVAGDGRLLERLAQELMPTATEEEISHLTPAMLRGVLKIASGRLEDLLGPAEDAEGKAAPPAAGRASPTPLDTSSPASPGSTAPA